jgi:hypothetical protein
MTKRYGHLGRVSRESRIAEKKKSKANGPRRSEMI